MAKKKKETYLEGLAKGLELDDSTPERKLILALIEAQKDTQKELEEAQAELETVRSELDDIADFLDGIAEVFAEMSEHEHSHGDGEECGCGECCGADAEYTLTCPKCSGEITVSEEMLDAGSVTCPACHEKLDFEFYEDEDEEEAEF
ncbi:MAG: hypothetical protein LBO63_01270 [Oscillospiraceae bacterium]|jgi:hypothetical protein|nr:hypothetical protein [Oscillospiraceae bacterium]